MSRGPHLPPMYPYDCTDGTITTEILCRSSEKALQASYPTYIITEFDFRHIRDISDKQEKKYQALQRSEEKQENKSLKGRQKSRRMD